jgi:CDP-paratose 2-epimerase
MRTLVTGNAGLIGSEAAEYFYRKGHKVYGIDNNMRRQFFGPDGDTTATLKQLLASCPGITQYDSDIREREGIDWIIREVRPDAIIHCAAQPSHDLAAKMPFEDFHTNAVGTLNLLEAVRQHCPRAAFVHVSTNKVYGDAPNRIPLFEQEKRWEYSQTDATLFFTHGIAENFTIDQSLHSLFGASKLSGDILAQEYGRYFNMYTGVFRGGCLTGARHNGAELHGYLSYFFKAMKEDRTYTIYGYKGKQVRDQIHSRDVVRAFDEFIQNPRMGEVYNLGGGYQNSVSILESIERVEKIFGRPFKSKYDPTNRIGDHIVYYSDLRKLKAHYPKWDITMSLDDIFTEFAEACGMNGSYAG